MDAPKASEPNKPSQEGLIRALSNLLSSHASLFVIELEEAKGFAWSYFVHVAIIVVCSVLFFIMFSVGVVVYFWDSYRLTAILALLGSYLLIIMIALVNLIRIKKKTKLFISTKEELLKDKEELLS
ncbi:phage holin family protein [Entomomonas sp. E2T0]|uniref:phage holin family protein n=1 Tax=Entomomonas sp. E2T0 TaxID=2930213 RepID=UPI0022284312|nr:phage holin family protein [Entomomonas sp. E2T0]UYZ83969.1 phage holin family protein [Entomomonas sp. E2T0]